jgi:peptidoglycan/xylan/chitin deacetylase (PgdA/CDA1 family)
MQAVLKQAARATVDRVGDELLRPPRGGFGYFKNHGPRTERAVALTFDDGPSRPATEELLARLKELAVPATFFCVGLNVEKNPDLVARAHEAGHVIASHSMDHRRACALSPFGEAHIADSERAIERIIGKRPALYRPPWGWLTPWEGKRLTRRGYTVVGWDVFTLDWQTPPPPFTEIAAGAQREVQPGSILLFHDGRTFQDRWEAPATIEAVTSLIPALRNDGYRFVTVSELLRVPAYRA